MTEKWQLLCLLVFCGVYLVAITIGLPMWIGGGGVLCWIRSGLYLCTRHDLNGVLVISPWWWSCRFCLIRRFNDSWDVFCPPRWAWQKDKTVTFRLKSEVGGVRVVWSLRGNVKDDYCRSGVIDVDKDTAAAIRVPPGCGVQFQVASE